MGNVLWRNGSDDGVHVQQTIPAIVSWRVTQSSTSGIATTGAHQTTIGGVQDAFLVKVQYQVE